MSKIASIFLFVLMAGAGYGQQEHFALIRTDNDQPFYVRIRQQTQSSSAQGHLILSELHDSLYPIAIGFPREQFPEQEFILKIDKNDLDLRLIYRQGKGWILADMGTQEEQLPANDTTGKKVRLEGIKKDDAFSRLMADVVSDTAVMYNTYAEEASRDSAARIADSLAARKAVDSLASARRAADSLAAQVAADSLAARKAISLTTGSLPKGADSAAIAILKTNLPSGSPPDGMPARRMSVPDSAITRKAPASDSVATRKQPPPDSPAPRPVLKAAVFTGTLDSLKVDSSIRHIDSGKIVQKIPPPPKPARIEKIAEQQTAAGLRISYTDRRKGHHTDTINIQIPSDSSLNTGRPDTGSARQAQGPQIDKITGTPPQIDKIPGTPPQTGAPVAPRAKLVVVNSDCHNFASDDDVDKLKLKFQTLSADDAKIAATKKVFKLKCFTTNQLKTLSESFPVEQAKYSFLEASYPFVSDDGFRSLSALFTDPIYIAKFKTLVGAP